MDGAYFLSSLSICSTSITSSSVAGTSVPSPSTWNLNKKKGRRQVATSFFCSGERDRHIICKDNEGGLAEHCTEEWGGCDSLHTFCKFS